MTYRPSLWIALHAVAIVLLASQLPPDAWFVGDSGIKLIATNEALAHPRRPFEVDAIPLQQEFPQPFLAPHGDHAHAMTQQAFPVFTAPLLSLFGLRGAYVLPALGWLIAVPLMAQLAMRLQLRASPIVISIFGMFGTPLVFYGLEFWEHAPAVAAILAVAVLLLPQATPRHPVFAGVVAGVSVLLRAEAAWWVAGILAAVWMRHRTLDWLPRVAAGGAAVIAPLVAYNVVHLGSIGGPHVSANVASSASWWTERVAFASTWFAFSRVSIAGAFVGLAGLFCVSPLVRRAHAESPGWSWTNAITLAGICVALALMLELTHRHEARENFWGAFPAGVLALLPGVATTRERRVLWWLVLAPAAGVLLTTATDGGGQWGPRYLLPSVPFLLLLAVDSLGALGQRFERTTLFTGFAALVLATMASWNAWVELSNSKQSYATLVHGTAANAQDATYVVTDIWWLGQVHAAVLPPGRVLHVERARGKDLLARLEGADVLLVEEAPPHTPLEFWTDGTCYTPRSRRPSRDGRLQYVRLTCR